MARSRLIKPGLAENEVLAELGPHAQLLFALLPCHADRKGRLEDRPKRIKAKVFPYYDVDVDALLDQLANCSERFIVRYEVNGERYIQISNFAVHQRPHHKEEESEIPGQNDQQAMDESCMDQARPIDESSTVRAPYKVKETSNKVKETRSKEEGVPTNHFATWWQAVHQRKGKRDAERAYDAAVKRVRSERPAVDAHLYLLDRMRLFASSPEASPDDREPIHPATWLNGGRYDDDPATWQRKATGAKPGVKTYDEIFEGTKL